MIRKPITVKSFFFGILVLVGIGFHGFITLAMLGFGLGATQGYSDIQRLAYALKFLIPFAVYVFVALHLWHRSRYSWAMVISWTPFPLMYVYHNSLSSFYNAKRYTFRLFAVGCFMASGVVAFSVAEHCGAVGDPGSGQHARHLMPNKSVKGTRRPVAVLKFSFLSRFGGFAQVL